MSRGVMILIRKGFDCQVLRNEIDTDGRIIAIEISLNDNNYILLNVYAPNEDRPLFFTDQSFGQGILT